MSKFNKLFDLASKALGGQDAGPSSASRSSGAQPGGDWRTMAQGIADRVGLTPPPAGGSAPSRPADAATTRPAGAASARPAATPPAGSDADRAAIARYDYLLRTADPDQVEQAHREAFERLTPQQRTIVQERMRAELPSNEQPRSAEPVDLARAAGRSEARRPGIMEGLLARAGGAGGGRGRSLAGGAALAGGAGILGLVAGGAIASAVAAPLMAAASGIDFDALAQGVDVDALAGGVEGFAGDALGSVEGIAGDALGGVSDVGEQASGIFDGFGDLF